MRLMSQTWRDPHIAILLGPAFEEDISMRYLTILRSSGLRVSLTALNSAPVHSFYGVPIVADRSISDLLQDDPCQLVIVLGRQQCVSTLLTDPRVHSLMLNTVAQDGYVAITAGAEVRFCNARPLSFQRHRERFLLQGDINVGNFAQSLIDMLVDRPQPDLLEKEGVMDELQFN